MNMKKILFKLFAWISEAAACEQAMYEAIYDERVKPLIDKILSRDEQIARLEHELTEAKKEQELKKTEISKPKRKYNRKKKNDDKA